jgi:hypothetical protein
MAAYQEAVAAADQAGGVAEQRRDQVRQVLFAVVANHAHAGLAASDFVLI